MSDTPHTQPRFHGPENPCNTYPLAILDIANRVVLTYQVMQKFKPGATMFEAIDATLEYVLEDANNARHHLGSYRFGITSEEKYAAQFRAMVVHDAQHDVTRPRTGNILEAIHEAVDKQYQNFLESACIM